MSTKTQFSNRKLFSNNYINVSCQKLQFTVISFFQVSFYIGCTHDVPDLVERCLIQDSLWALHHLIKNFELIEKILILLNKLSIIKSSVAQRITRFDEIINQTEAENFCCLPWQTNRFYSEKKIWARHTTYSRNHSQ